MYRNAVPVDSAIIGSGDITLTRMNPRPGKTVKIQSSRESSMGESETSSCLSVVSRPIPTNTHTKLSGKEIAIDIVQDFSDGLEAGL